MVLNNTSFQGYALRMYSASLHGFSRSVSRLSSGVRVQNGLDDAAGLAMSARFDERAVRIQAVQQVMGNALSYFQVRDGYLSLGLKHLDRMGELAVLATDPAKNERDRQAYDEEFQRLKVEIEGYSQKSFNGGLLFFPENPETPPSTVFDPSVLPPGLRRRYEQTGEIPPGWQTRVYSYIFHSAGTFDVPLNEDIGTFRPVSFDLAAALENTGVNISSQASAAAAVAYVQDSRYFLTTARAIGGADMERVLMAVAQLQDLFINIRASSSRIKDANFADETARMVRYDLLLRSSESVMTQANVLPANALKLLESGSNLVGGAVRSEPTRLLSGGIAE